MRIAPIAVCVALVGPGATAGQTTEEVLAGAEATYRQIATLQANFTQTLVNPMLGAPETTTGVLFLNPPEYFAMRFREPERDRIVADGTWLWLYTPSTVERQVIRQPIPEVGPATPNLFAQFVDRPLERYRASYVGRDTVAGATVENVRLIPRRSDIPFRSVVISLSGDGMLRRVNIVESSGQRRIIVFDDVVVNAPIDGAEFVFDVPRGVRIVTP